ncbi:MAG: rhamnan synthesis F family protein, partial [Legionella sp.]|nr:rhamnan synthesis F family protein [Legionella sp.]
AYDPKLGTFWRRQLYDALCGDTITVSRHLEILKNSKIGMIGPQKYFLKHWGSRKNKPLITNILSRSGIQVPENGPDLGFFAGTMFWFTPEAFNAIYQMPASSLQFEPEPTKQDGTLTHVWERLFCLLSRAAGYAVTTVDLNGKDIFIHDPANKRIPKVPGLRMPNLRNMTLGTWSITMKILSKFKSLIKNVSGYGIQ